MSGETQSLRSAIQRLGDAAREELVEHPDAGDVAAYVAGELEGGRVGSIEEHLATCRDCTALALDLESFPEILPDSTFERPTRDQVEADWRVLQARLRRDAAITRAPLLPRRGLELLAASLLVTTLGAGVWALSLRQQVRHFAEPRPNVEIVELLSEQDPVRGGSPERSISATGSKLWYLHLPFEAPHYGDYAVEILPAGGERVLWRRAGLERHRGESFTLEVPDDFLPPGRYRIVAYGVESGRGVEIATYSIHITP